MSVWDRLEEWGPLIGMVMSSVCIAVALAAITVSFLALARL